MKKKPIQSNHNSTSNSDNDACHAHRFSECLPAFPAGHEGRDMLVAVPVLLMVPIGKACSVTDTVADAVAIVRSSQICVEGVEVKYWALANTDEVPPTPHSSVRSNFLGRAIEALNWVSDAMVKVGGHNSEEVKQVEREAIEVLYLLNASDPSKVSG
jgi:hypothetical protein